MIPDQRRVGTLTLRGQDPRAVADGETVVREALQLAAFAGDGMPGRLLIRALDVEVSLGQRRVEQTTRALSEALARALAQAIVFSSAGAAGAPAVRVAHRLDVWLELGRRACAPPPFDVSAWFWPRLVPELPGRDRAGALQLVIRALLTTEPGLPALSAFTDSLVEAGHAAPLLEQLGPRHGGSVLAMFPSLAAAFGNSAPHGTAPEESRSAAVGPATRAESAGLAQVSPRWREVLTKFVPRWGALDPRSVWLCASALDGAVASRSAAGDFAARALHLARDAASRSQLASLSEVFEPGSGAAPEHHSASTAEPTARKPAGLETSPPAPDTTHYAPGALGELCPSEFAGLFFLVGLLAHLGLERSLEQDPRLSELNLGVRVLSRIADRLEVPKDDPILRPLAAASSFVAAPIPTAAELDLIDDWAAAAVNALSPFELDLKTLVRRQGRIALTRTHVDLIFDINAADVRVRRAGLDIDPGYVNYLGRILKFHYRSAV